jgi:DNA mismatch endonuclease, patch repair protein
MSRVRGKDTRPEMVVRRQVFAAGYRYRLHAVNLPGKPDLVFPGRHKAIFVHGCFWHRHLGCSFSRMPKSRVEFWTVKLEGNRARDARNEAALRTLGWSFLTVWECELGDMDSLLHRITAFLETSKRGHPS